MDFHVCVDNYLGNGIDSWGGGGGGGALGKCPPDRGSTLRRKHEAGRLYCLHSFARGPDGGGGAGAAWPGPKGYASLHS